MEFVKKEKYIFDPDVIRTRSLLIWSQTRYHCATESLLRRRANFFVTISQWTRYQGCVPNVSTFRSLICTTWNLCTYQTSCEVNQSSFSSGFYFRINWISMERPCFLQNHSFISFSFLQGRRSLKNWLLQKLSMNILDQKLFIPHWKMDILVP